MAEEINNILDALVDDFRYVLDLAIEWMDDPKSFEPDYRKLNELLDIFDKWFK